MLHPPVRRRVFFCVKGKFADSLTSNPAEQYTGVLEFLLMAPRRH